MFRWMRQEADRQQLSEAQRIGAILLDECSIQQDLSTSYRGTKTCFFGQVSTVPIADALRAEKTGMDHLEFEKQN